MGKTNILEAIYYICLGKGYFTTQDKFGVQHEKNIFRIESAIGWETGETDTIAIKYTLGGKKELEYNGTGLERLSEHLGRLPCVIFAPEDIKLLLNTSEARRNFLNQTLVQIDKEYLRAIHLYNKLLKSRNAYLKQQSFLRSFNDVYLESLQEQMKEPAQTIFLKRKLLVEMLNAYFTKRYAQISGEKESCLITYESQLSQDDIMDLWTSSLATDKNSGRTTCGIHKDDLVLHMDDKAIKNFGSQGQLKSFILALKLAQYRVLENNNPGKPIILLDDIFDKLDGERVNHLLHLLSAQSMGQVFITDTDEKRIPGVLQDLEIPHKHFTMEEGTLAKQEEYEAAQR